MYCIIHICTVNHKAPLHNATAYLTQHALSDLCAVDKHLTRDRLIHTHTHTWQQSLYYWYFIVY